MLYRRISILPISLVVALLGSSCAHYEKPKFNRGIGANGAVTLIVPFRESKNRRWYGESETGTKVAQIVMDYSNENADDPIILDFEEPDVARLIERLRDNYHKDDIHAADWKKLVSGLGVKYVVEGDMGEMRLTHPKTINAYDAKFECEFRVINAITGKIAYRGQRTGTFVSGSGGQDRIDWQSPSGESDRRVRHVAIENLAEQIAKDLYGSWDE